MRRFLVLAVFAVLALGAGVFFIRKAPATVAPARRSGRVETRASFDEPLVEVPDGLAWIAIGGGAEPESSQVQIEQDVQLASHTFGGPGLVLFGGGRGRVTVRELGPEPRYPDRALARLAELFDARDRAARYRATRLSPDAPATEAQVEHAIRRAMAHPGAPLLVFVAAHGEQGEAPIDNDILLWGGTPWSVRDLADTIDTDTAPRPLRLIVTSCYGGGFADAALGLLREDEREGDRCGLFATSWDRLASGCDSDPNRSAQEGYGLHVLKALVGQRRDGAPLPLEEVDLDHDGRVSLLEAHTYARLASRSFDLPTTTSERWLRAATVERDMNPDDFEPMSVPEEDRVIGVLGAELDAREPRIAHAMLDRLADELDAKEADLDEAEDARDDAYRRLRIELLERWPILDDPWHPRFHATVDAHREEILRLLERSPLAAAYRRADTHAAELESEYDALEVDYARVARLVAAYDHERMAAALRARDRAGFARYERLRACERWVPPVRSE